MLEQTIHEQKPNTCIFWINIQTGEYGYGKPFKHVDATVQFLNECEDLKLVKHLEVDSYQLELELARQGVERQEAHRLALENFKD